MVKAEESMTEARKLYSEKHYNGAANRAYYSVFQALVAFWEADGFDAKDFKSKDSDGKPTWRHHYLHTNIHKGMMLSDDQKMIIRTLWTLRVKADYEPEPVQKHELTNILDEASGIIDVLLRKR